MTFSLSRCAVAVCNLLTTPHLLCALNKFLETHLLSPHEPLGHKFSSQKDPNAQHTKKIHVGSRNVTFLLIFKHGWQVAQCKRNVCFFKTYPKSNLFYIKDQQTANCTVVGFNCTLCFLTTFFKSRDGKIMVKNR